jgi:acetyl esterase/lipase
MQLSSHSRRAAAGRTSLFSKRALWTVISLARIPLAALVAPRLSRGRVPWYVASTAASALVAATALAGAVHRAITQRVQVHRDVFYASYSDYLPASTVQKLSPRRRKQLTLDLFVPPAAAAKKRDGRVERRLPPLLVYIHGGLWVSRDKADYSNVGFRWSSLDAQRERAPFAVATLNYRLSNEEQFAEFAANPAVADDASGERIWHPMHTHDAYAALLFLLDSANAARFGYDQQRLVLVGHSCGAHMAALIALNPLTFMPPSIRSTRAACSAAAPCYVCLARRLHASLLRGCVVGVSGLYDLPAFCNELPEWASELYAPMTSDRSRWIDPIDVSPDIVAPKKSAKYGAAAAAAAAAAPATTPCVAHLTTLPAFLLLNSQDDAYIPVSQVWSLLRHLRKLLSLTAPPAGALSIPRPVQRWIQSDVKLRGKHFQIIEEIQRTHDAQRTPLPDQITPRLLAFLQDIGFEDAQAE